MTETPRMPVLFIGHGSPMNAIEDNDFSRAWAEAARRIPKPKSILCISAHWETETPAVTAMANPRTIHDFYGFPKELNEKEYPAPGSAQLARQIVDLFQPRPIDLDQRWGWTMGHGQCCAKCIHRRISPSSNSACPPR